MRPTKKALIEKVCTDQTLFEYEIVDILSDDSLREETARHSEDIIYSIAASNRVDAKLFLTSHQFTNIVGTDIYIYIGTAAGQKAYQLILEELSDARRLDEKIITFLRDEYTDTMTELHVADDDTAEKLENKINTQFSDSSDKVLFAVPSESQLNKGLGQLLLDAKFDSIGDSHIFIYTANGAGQSMVSRLSRESFMS